MAIMTNTGGEVHTLEQLVSELEGIAKEAAADLDDAHAHRARAHEDGARFETMAASLHEHDLDQQTLGEISALMEPAAQRKSAADDRASAAEQMLARAQTALRGVQDRHSLMAEAHAATPHAAKKEFYTG